MLWDTHMHTHHSGDSDALMPDMIQAAVRQNLDGICFTDHFDYDYPDDPNLFLLDFDSYIKEVRSFQDTCRDRLSIRRSRSAAPHHGNQPQSSDRTSV